MTIDNYVKAYTITVKNTQNAFIANHLICTQLKKVSTEVKTL